MPTLCHIDDLDDQCSKGFEIDELNVFAVKKEGQIYVYKNSCPHLGVELNWQEDQFLDIENALIQCSTHGALFIIENGQCVAGPCLGENLQLIPFNIEDGMITVS